ncbi:MAG: hypothetical protein AAFW75_12275 [Cyanobacteria bacterium J06636_16]
MQSSLGFSGHFSSFLCLMFFTSACSQSHITFSHTEQIEILPTQLEKTEDETVENRQSREDIENLRDNAYVEALENLRLFSEADPDTAYVINSLIEHPDQAYEMFEGC